MSELALLEYGKPFGTQRFLKRAPQHTQEIWEREEIAPRAIDREVACSLHMTHMGCSSLPEALVRQSLRSGLSDGWGGSMMGTEFSDVLFGTPKPIETEANLGVMNLLPLPALDGGRLFLYIVELIIRRPIPKEKEGMIHFIGFILLMVLMVFLIFNDIRKIIL